MESGRRRITLYDQMLAVGDGREVSGGLTLNDVLSTHKSFSPSPSPAVSVNGRTLLDIIRDDVGKPPAGNRERKSWKFLRDRLRMNLRSHIPPPNSLRLAALLSTETTPNEEQSPESTAGVPALRLISRRNSTSSNQNTTPSSEATNSDDPPVSNISAASIAADAEATGNGEEVTTAADTAAPVRMSLMDLLEETDRQMGLEAVEEKEDVNSEVAAVCGGGTDRNCCVCMVRDKGAAFIPCGHTFCRLCSRELWVNRGNCPLCNAHILEILDIF